jgi:hypothetical protein
VEALMKKIDAASFDYEDFMKQNEMISKMGSMRSMVKMMPGAPRGVLARPCAIGEGNQPYGGVGVRVWQASSASGERRTQ